MQTADERDECVMALLEAALLRPVPERESFVRLECADDESLYREVMEELAWDERIGSFLRDPFLDLASSVPPFEPGQAVADRFEIVREIGEGGMGIVYEAIDRRLQGKRIAIKASKPGFQRLLTPELEGALRVRHRNVCLVNEVHTANTKYGQVDFLTMEFLDGETLADHLERDGRMPDGSAFTIARQLCLGLAEAHRSGIIHRDLKTSNVILTRNADGTTRAVITDFGLATIDSDANVLAGTPRYIAPEVWDGKPATQASDIYALGVILCELVKRLEPEEKVSAANLAEARAEEGIKPRISSRWVRTVRACLNPHPGERPADAIAVLKGLEKRRYRWAVPLAIPLLAASTLLSPSVRTRLRDLIWPPPGVRLVVLPPSGSNATALTSNGALDDVFRRLSQAQTGTRSLAVVSPEDAHDLGIETPDQAKATLHATHALETRTYKDGEDTVVQGSVVDLDTDTHVRDFKYTYSPATVGVLAGALAGEVSSGLGLRALSPKEALSADAAGPYDRGLYLSRQGQNAEAISLFEDAARLDPRSPMPLTALVEAETQRFYDTKDAAYLDRAQQYLQTAQSLDPDAVSVHLAAGRFYETNGKLKKALDEYLRVRTLAPTNLRAARRAAWIYDRLDEPDQAIAEYRRAIAVDPSFFETYAYFGGFYYNRGQYSAAVEQWRKVIALAPGRYQTWRDLGVVLQRLGDYAGAEQALRTGLKMGEHPDLLQNMGAVLSEQGRDAEAMPYYDRAAALQPGEYVIWYNLGDANRRLGNRKAAREDYQNGLDMAEAQLQQNPQNAFARSYVGYFAARLGQRTRAQEETAQALHAEPADAPVRRHAVLTYEALGLRQKAFDCLTGVSLEFLHDLQREPDLADFCRDPRFQELIRKFSTGGK